MGNFVIRHESEVSAVACPCGEATRIITAKDGGPCSVHVTVIHEAKRHLHEHTTEYYYILSGNGRVQLGEDWFPIRPGHTMRIDAGTPHRVIAEGGEPIRTMVIAYPPFDPTDEVVLER